MKRVFLIDSMSHIYRAFFAPMGMKQDPLRNSKGQVTQAVYVFTNMLRKLLNDEKPEYIAAVWDSLEGTFRDDISSTYKANREAMPDDLTSQLPLIEQVLDAFCIPVIKYDRFEADDIIGTLSKQIAVKKMQCVIVSNDKDLCQLVHDPYVVCMRNNSTNVKRKVPVPAVEWCDEEWVKKKFGVGPDKIIDLLGLMGDSVDNIPGAPGIGEKGALKIILEFGSAEEAMRRADEVTHKTYRESLLNNQDLIRQSLELATIHCEVPVTLDLDDLTHCEPDRRKAYEIFRELEFRSLTNEFADYSSPSTGPTSGGGGGLFDDLPTHTGPQLEAKYTRIDTREELDKLIRRLFEVQTWSYHVNDSNSSDKASCYERSAPIGVAIGFGNGEAFYIELEKIDELSQRHLRDILTNPFLYNQAHDAKRNAGALLKMGFQPEPVKDDVLIAAYLLDPGRGTYPMDHLAQVYLDIDLARSVPGGWDEIPYRAVETADMIARLA